MRWKQRHLYQWICSLILLSILLGACNQQSDSNNTPDSNIVGTAAAQTVAVQMQQFTKTVVAQKTSTLIPLINPSPTLSDLALTPTIAATSGPIIMANADTNCREGPDTGYLRVGMLLADQKSIVRGRNVDSSWWYIDHPTTPGSNCWVWGGSTAVQGDTSGLPVITAPPLPPTVAPTYGGVSATVEYGGVAACANDTGMVTFIVENTGSVELKSMELTIRDIQVDAILYSGVVNSPFMLWLNDCVGSINLQPGLKSSFGGIIQPPIPWKRRGRAIIRLCSDYNATGECVGFRIEFYFID